MDELIDVYRSFLPKLDINQIIYLAELVNQIESDNKEKMLEEMADLFYKKITNDNWLHILKNISGKSGYSIFKEKIKKYFLSKIMKDMSNKMNINNYFRNDYLVESNWSTPYSILFKNTVKENNLKILNYYLEHDYLNGLGWCTPYGILCKNTVKAHNLEMIRNYD